jgi:hypothetical protein
MGDNLHRIYDERTTQMFNAQLKHYELIALHCILQIALSNAFSNADDEQIVVDGSKGPILCLEYINR